MNADPAKMEMKLMLDYKSMIKGKTKSAIDKWVVKYPDVNKQAAVIPALHVLQDANGGHLTTAIMDELAEYLQMPKIAVYEVASFYSMFEHKPVGLHKISICTNISCMLRGSEEIVEHLKNKFGIGLGQTTPDGKYTIKEVECLGACAGAPMCLIGREYYEYLTPEKIDSIIEQLD